MFCVEHGGATFADLPQSTPSQGSPDPSMATIISVPVLNSRPGAKATLYLDFDGDPGGEWGSFDTTAHDGYAGSEAELKEIWARVAEKFSPFDVNVTTVNPGTLQDGRHFRVVIGGDGAWVGEVCGGISYLGSFTNGAPNTAYVFSENLGGGWPKYVAEAVAHESGHGFGLQHQSVFNGGEKIEEYNPGNASVAPTMGNSYSSFRGVWWRGTGSNGAIQDDMAVLAGAINGFGYRPDDFGNRISSARKLAVRNGKFTARGVIERGGDVDFVKFSMIGGSVELKLRSITAGATFDGKVIIYRANGTIIATADGASLGETVTLNLASGTYYVGVASHGSQGDVGQFTLYGTVTASAGTVPGRIPPSSVFGTRTIGTSLDEIGLG
jgi:hypothetical protein